MWEMNLLQAIPASEKNPTTIYLLVGKRGEVHRFSLPEHGLPAVVESPDGVGDEEAPRLDILKRDAVVELGPGQRVNQIKCGVLGGITVVVAVSDMLGDRGCVKVFPVEDFSFSSEPKPVLEYVHRAPVWSIAIHDGNDMIDSRLAVGTNGYDILWWNCPIGCFNTPAAPTANRQVPPELLRRTLEGHEHNVPAVSFSPCGQYLASASIDASLRLWDLESEIEGAHLVLLQSAPDLVSTAAWGWSIDFVPVDSVTVVSRKSNNSARASGASEKGAPIDDHDFDEDAMGMDREWHDAGDMIQLISSEEDGPEVNGPEVNGPEEDGPEEGSTEDFETPDGSDGSESSETQ